MTTHKTMPAVTIIIDEEHYGSQPMEFATLEEAQASIRTCGGDFAGTTLEFRGGNVYDEQGHLCGRSYIPHDGVTEWADCLDCGRRLDPVNDFKAPRPWDGSCYHCGASAERVGLRR